MSIDAMFRRYLCLAVDVQGYGARDDIAQGEIQRVLVQLLDTAAVRADVDRRRWQRQTGGDEELALIPAGEAPQRVVGEFCFELAALLHRQSLQAGRGGRLRLRMAIDEGPVRQGANGFVGRAVVGASRLVNSSAARQALADEPDAALVVVLSHVVHRDWVASGRSALDRDQFRRIRVREKEVDEDAWLWVPGARTQRDSAVADPTPLRAAQTLPADVADFVGRQDELERLLVAVGDGATEQRARTVAIHAVDGMAGVGKTAFAVHAAHRLAARFPDGRLFVDLQAHKPGHARVDPAAALAALLQADGVAAAQIPADMDARAALWRDRMAHKRALLVLDDAAGAAHVAPLLPGAPGCLVLVTSRRKLTVLPDAAFVSLDILPPGSAAELFLSRAATAGVRADRVGPVSVERIIRLCGNLPLAIVLTVARLHTHPTWTVADLADDLDRTRDRLAGLASGDLAVAAAFDLSYRDLPADRQRLFRRLGLHTGPDLDAYAAAALDDASLAATSRGLEDLLEHSLITEPHRGRFRFHDLIAEHARTMAATDTPAEQDAALDRLLGFYLHTVTAAARMQTHRTPPAVHQTSWVPVETPALASRQQATDWLNAEQSNLVAVAGWAAARRRTPAAVGIPAALHDHLRIQGPWTLALNLHHAALAGARDADDHPGQALTLTNLADAQRLTDDYPAATTTLGQALDLYRQLGDLSGQANALNTLGVVQHQSGHYAAAAITARQVLDLYRLLGDQLGQAHALSTLGIVRCMTGDLAGAATSAGLALDLYRHLGCPLGQANALHILGRVQYLSGDYPAATTSAAQALVLSRQLGNRYGQANALQILGRAQCMAGDFKAATISAGQALDLYRQLGCRLGQANALHILGIVLNLIGDHRAATISAGRAVDLYRQLGCQLGQANALHTLGVGQYQIGGYPPAATPRGHALARSPAGVEDTARRLRPYGPVP
ncbi:ATP-binding protein [Dactylosporangium sp. McL0621]|uniref:ATP-binding protein n=1 Tax=Dactylosporangium sp. McL0621 TaxID=3415678 RepID=UPI003CF7C421